MIGIEEIVGKQKLRLFPGYFKDPLKLVIGFKDEYSGKEFKELLQARNIQWEKSSSGCIEFLLTVGTFLGHLEELLKAVQEGAHLLGRPDPDSFTDDDFDFETATGQVEVLPRRAALSNGELIGLEASEGRICAQMLVPYPPGIPVFLPGFRITESMICRVQRTIKDEGGHSVHGLFEHRGKYFVKVMKLLDEEAALNENDPERKHILRLREIVGEDRECKMHSIN